MRRAVVLVPLAFLAATVPVAVSYRGSIPEPLQPVRFDHARHLKEDLNCLDCHKTAETSRYASLPKIATCRLCHDEPKGKSAEEGKVHEYLEKGEEIPWLQANRMPGHVYFSHAMHVKIGKLACSTCHGEMEQATEPVTRSQIEWLTMRQCMGCHTDRGASNDCLACHQ